MLTTSPSGRERGVLGAVRFAVSPRGLQQTFRVTVGSELINSGKGTESYGGNETRPVLRCPDGLSVDAEWKNNTVQAAPRRSTLKGRREGCSDTHT